MSGPASKLAVRDAAAWIAPLLLIATSCLVRIPDANRDGVVDLDDVALADGCQGLDLAAHSECAGADTDADGDVDARDVAFIAAHVQGPRLPTLVSSDPASGATNVPRSAWIRLAFDAAPDPAAKLVLACNGAPQTIAVHALGAASLLVDPTQDLPESKHCTLWWFGPQGVEARAFDVATSGAPATVVYDRVDGGLTTPFPDDFWLVPDASKATGQRVALVVPDREPDVVNLFTSLITETQALDGFSPLGGISVELSDAPDRASLPMTQEASLDPLATVGLFDLTPGSDTYGQRVPFDLHVRNDQLAGQPMTHALIAFPSIPLTPRGRYGFVVTRRALVSPSRPFDPSSFFAAALAPPTPGEAAEVAGVRAVASDVTAALATDVSPPLPAEDLAIALRITVRSTDAIPRDLLAMKQQVLDAPPPQYTITSVTSWFQPFAAVVRGTWKAPDWRNSVFLSRDAAGLPKIKKTVDRSFIIMLPSSALSGHAPLIMYQHGNPGSSEEVLYNGYEASKGFASAGFTDALNRDFSDVNTQIFTIFGTILLSGHVPEYWAETHGEQFAFLRMLQSLGSLDVLPIGAPDGVPDLDVTTLPIAYLGVSEGANHGQAFLPYAPEIRAGVLKTGGERLSEVLVHEDETGRGAKIAEFVAQQIPNIRPPDVWAGLAIFQMIFDPQDPQNHAGYLYRDRRVVAGTTRKPSVLEVEGIGDGFVPNNATRSLAWFAGPIPHLRPIRQSVSYLEQIGGPLAGNIDAETTAAFVQYVPAGIPGLPPSSACLYEYEGHYCGQEASTVQAVDFMLSALHDPAPVIQEATGGR